MDKCYIIVLNYKKWDDTLACIKSVFNSSYQDFSLIVADNYSENNSLESIIANISADPVVKAGSDKAITFIHVKENGHLPIDPADLPDLVLLQNHKNAGFGAGNNIVLQMLLKENAYIWLLNPDMTVEHDTLANLIHSAKENPQTIIGAVTRSFDNPDTILFYGGGRINYLSGTVSLIANPGQISDMDYVSGGSMFIHTSYLKIVGLLPEDYFLYWEETDWCYLARKKGLSLTVSLSAVCYDKISTTIGRGFISDYFYTRNGLLFLKKYKPIYTITTMIAVLGRVVIRLIRGEKERARGMMKGVIDFLTGGRYENQ